MMVRLLKGIWRKGRAYLDVIRYRPRSPESFDISTGYEIYPGTNSVTGSNGWLQKSVAERQHKTFLGLVDEVKRGKPRIDFLAAVSAIKATELADPFLVEIGCGSGYYFEILSILLGRNVRYLGIDYSFEMISIAREAYPKASFMVGDACCLPLREGCCDIVLSGVSLMHILDYRRAISESVRVTNGWCIFHTVPLMERRGTTCLRKLAYGSPVLELIFNKSALEREFKSCGLVIKEVFESIPYDVSHIVGEPTWTLTYLCQKGSKVP